MHPDAYRQGGYHSPPRRACSRLAQHRLGPGAGTAKISGYIGMVPVIFGSGRFLMVDPFAASNLNDINPFKLTHYLERYATFFNAVHASAKLGESA